MIAAALVIAQGLIGIAMLLAAWRLVQGPYAVDRILALDTLYTNGLALLVVFGIRMDDRVYFEAALVIALLGFIGTVALARYVLRGDVIDQETS